MQSLCLNTAFLPIIMTQTSSRSRYSPNPDEEEFRRRMQMTQAEILNAILSPLTARLQLNLLPSRTRRTARRINRSNPNSLRLGSSRKRPQAQLSFNRPIPSRGINPQWWRSPCLVIHCRLSHHVFRHVMPEFEFC